MTSSPKPRRPRVAIAGIRGIPARFGGSETAAEQIGERLSTAGYDVVVYCRSHNSEGGNDSYHGMRRVVLPSVNSFNFDTVSHSLVAALHVIVKNTADVMHFHGVGNGLVVPLLSLAGKRTVVTIDGPDWERPKWGRAARLALRAGAWLSVRFADALVIDNHPAIRYFEQRYGVRGTYIPYGADRARPAGSGLVRRLGLEPGGYVLFVGALVPDKGPDLLIDAYREVNTDLDLVIVGDSPFFPDYRRQLRDAAARDPRVRLVGYQYGDVYRELLANCVVYAHPLRSDGTSPALLQALGYGSCIVINSLPEALSAVGDAAIPFVLNDAADLARTLDRVLRSPDTVAEYRRRAREHAEREYNWDRVAAEHAALFMAVVDKPARRHTAVGCGES